MLIDEFQDTSVAQFKLFEKLLLGWEPGDGRSIFFVGDPMQSIYRFRNAEVSLFLRAIHQGIQQIPLIPLTLTLNFRSEEKLIAWFNQNFKHILPKETDLTSGAIPYSAVHHPEKKSVPGEETPLFSETVSAYACTGPLDEAKKIVDIIQCCRRRPNEKIAILVRSRLHLLKIIPALQAANIKFQALDIEPLSKRSEIQDLAALTRALHHRADRIAWLAVLRAPYCGLSLTDLHLIAQVADHHTIYEVLLNFSKLTTLSADGCQRLQRIVPILSQALFNRGRLPLSEWIEGAWLALGGPAGLNHANELLNTQAYFKLLMKFEQKNPIFKVELFTQQLQKLYAAPDAPEDAHLQIMTIHKAKGLEFDHVILPELQRKPIAESSRLLLWMERAHAQGGSHLILAPIKEASQDSDPMYIYLKEIEQKKLMHEAARLLYVAATRAKQSLHLLAVFPQVPDIRAWQPSNGSFLKWLWPYFKNQLPENFEKYFDSVEEQPSTTDLLLERVVHHWQLPALPSGRPWPMACATLESTGQPMMNRSPPKNARKNAWIGAVIHELLAQLAEDAPHFQIQAMENFGKRRLLELGLPTSQLTEAFGSIREALQKTLQDPRGLWILSAEHQDRKNEYALSAVIDQQVIHVVLDRTFVDADGIRWIIDYKTGHFNEKEINDYRSQLNRYAQVMALWEKRPIRLALYFPLCSAWQEVTL